MFLQLMLLFAVAAVTFLFALNKNVNNGKRLCIQCVTVILTCFSGFRSWRYGDLMHYCYAYLRANTPDWQLDTKSSDTVGLQLLFRAFGQLGFGFETVLFFTAAFCAIALGVIVYRYSPSPYFSYLMYIALGSYFFTYTGLKQSIASAFVMFAFIFIINKKPLRFLLLVLAAFLFHKPAIIFLLAYPIARKKIDKFYFAMLGAAAIAVVFFHEEIATWLSMLYYDTMEFTANESVGFKQTMMIMIIVLSLILRPVREYDTVYKCTFNIMVTAALIQGFAMYDNVFTRLSDYFFQFFVIFIPLMLETGDEQALKFPEHKEEIRYGLQRYYPFLKVGISLFGFGYYAWWLYNSGALVNEYRFIWQDSGETSLEVLERFIENGGVL